jgi:hypothetical protein
MSRDHNEPLLREMELLEAQQSTLTKELSQELNESRQKPVSRAQRVLVVHNWSVSGQHSLHQITASAQVLVRDVITLCLEHFGITEDISLYQLKFASKTGQAKLDLPCEF